MPNKTIAVYARAYRARADLSLVVQVDACRRLAARLGCADPDYFLERDASGCSIGEALDRLLTACTEGHVDAVVAASRDRLHLDPAMVAAILKSMGRDGVTVHFVRDDFKAEPV